MNALDAIANIALDAEPCRPSQLMEDACETHGTEMHGAECDLVVSLRQNLRSSLNSLSPVMVDWIAGMIEGAAEGLGEDDHHLRIGMRAASMVVRSWDPWAEFEDEGVMKTDQMMTMYVVVELPGGNLLKPQAAGPFASSVEAYEWAESEELDTNWIVTELFIPGLDVL